MDLQNIKEITVTMIQINHDKLNGYPIEKAILLTEKYLDDMKRYPLSPCKQQLPPFAEVINKKKTVLNMKEEIKVQ